MNHSSADPYSRSSTPTACLRARRGSVLVITMVVIFAIAGMVLSLGRWSRTELLVSANTLATLQASAAERGAEQYVMKILATDRANLHVYTQDEFAAITTGQGGGLFWIVRPDYGDPELPAYGLVDESTKININNANFTTLQRLPLMTDEIAASIVDWRDENENPTQTLGAESTVYMGRADGYNAKNANFETVEELLLVNGMTRDLLFGTNKLRRLTPVGITSSGSDGDENMVRSNGYFDYFTAWSKSTVTTGNNTTTPAGRIAINFAPRAIIKAMAELSDAEVDKLMRERQSTLESDDPYSTTWVSQAMGSNRLNNQITGQGLVYSADIVAASGNGRAFKRVRIVVDVSGTTPVVLYRRDITDQGWPLDPEVLMALRSGEAASLVNGSVF